MNATKLLKHKQINMKSNNRQEIYKKAIELWGKKSQLEMLQEESTELALAVRKYIRKPNDRTFNDLASEIADVEIMIEQVIVMFPVMINHINSEKQFKLTRLASRIEKKQFN
jgi:NTP pyrophosphatase (non-canonical NTP hydrolase)